MGKKPLVVALTRGRIFEQNLPLLQKAGIALTQPEANDRRLLLHSACKRYRFLVIRGADVISYVQLGAAAVGIVGGDMLLEADGGDVYEMLDLYTARCRLITAANKGYTPGARRLRVATRHVNIARRFFAVRGEQVQIIPLYGSLELAPGNGIADQIVDIADTGETLRSNGLEELEKITDISARLIVNKAAMRLQRKRIEELCKALRRVLENPASIPKNS